MHFSKKGGASSASKGEDAEKITLGSKRQLENGNAGDGEEDLEAKRRRVIEETRDIDADSEGGSDSDSSEDDRWVESLTEEADG